MRLVVPKVLIGAILAISAAGLLSGCYWIYGGQADKVVLMSRADGVKTFCDSGVYASGGLFSGEADAMRILNACILACRKHGFSEDGGPRQIDEAESILEPEEGWANTPSACQG
ncbi:hypothetical protein [Radicibacter daui]|uniref:hypothetical protein n=1 Tax=Radicibacter daui TaxID=3064829 RepID=UPI004046FAF9